MVKRSCNCRMSGRASKCVKLISLSGSFAFKSRQRDQHKYPSKARCPVAMTESNNTKRRCFEGFAQDQPRKMTKVQDCPELRREGAQPIAQRPGETMLHWGGAGATSNMGGCFEITTLSEISDRSQSRVAVATWLRLPRYRASRRSNT